MRRHHPARRPQGPGQLSRRAQRGSPGPGRDLHASPAQGRRRRLVPGIGGDTAHTIGVSCMTKYVGALDQGTTSTRFMIFDHAGGVVAIHQKEHEQIFPKPGWVEHDPTEIWARSQEVIKGALDKAGIAASDLAAVGITNQRETAVVWDKNTGKPSTTRSSGRTRGRTSTSTSSARTAARTASGPRSACPLATYFSGPKVKLDPRQRRRGARQGRGRRPAVRQHRHLVHLEPHRRRQRRRPRHRRHQRQSRTMLMNLETLDWDDEILGIMGIPKSMLPAIKASSEVYGTGVGDARRHPDRGRPRRPAGGPVRPDVLLRRRGEEHLRHGLLHAPQHRHQGRPVEERPAHDPGLQDRRPAGRVRPRGLDRHHRRPRPVAARQPGHDHSRPPRSRRWPRPSRTTAASTSSRRSAACSRRTGSRTPAASSPASPATSTRATSRGRSSRRPRGRPARSWTR